MRQVSSLRHRLSLSAAAVAALVAAGTGVAGTHAASAAAAGCQVSYTVTNQWQGGFGASVSVRNLGDPINGWKLTWSFPAGQTITQLWNGTPTQSGSQVTVTNLSYNGALPSGGSTEFGFNGSWNGSNPKPSSFALNGVTCTGGVTSASPSPSPSSSPTRSPSPSPSPSVTPGTGTPVERHGQLHVCGTTMCDKNNAKVQLRGVSSMWLNWETAPYAENLSALKWMRDNWNLQVFRAAMGVEPAGAYLSDPNKARAQVETIINNAVAAGVYVIVDFHAHEAHKEQAQAVAFFSDLAKRYGHLPNVIWEDWNEPLQLSWTGVLKPYHQAVVSAIRAADPDNIIVLGTPTWSQDVDTAATSPVSGTNLMYTLHFYSCTHGASLRAKGDAAIRAGLPLFVTEWGASNADGGLDGRVCLDEAQTWINWMKANGISWTAWKLDVGTDSTNILSSGAPVTGGWNNYLHGHAPFVVANMK
ncbi:cellulase family glycosylhydrolase [Microbispora sp. NPDC049633]|uniref:cellulase family glycosylhydrolase n=1 Tax=Microbispora sp. NPDC049633 TaxID=3154355 RepID=UPI0034428977